MIKFEEIKLTQDELIKNYSILLNDEALSLIKKGYADLLSVLDLKYN